MLEAEASVAAQESSSVRATDLRSGGAVTNGSSVGDAHRCEVLEMACAIAGGRPCDKSRGRQQGD